MTKLISSQQNPIFGDLKKLLTSKGIHKQNKFLLWGEKFVAEVLRDSPEAVDSLLVGPGHKPPASASVAANIELTSELFKELDLFGTGTPILVCKIPVVPKMSVTRKASGLELLIAVSEPSNLGTIIRSAVSFGVRRIILLKESASPFHPKSVRASAGHVLKVSYEIGPSILDLDKNLLDQTLALDMQGESLNAFQWPQNAFLLVGEEGRGLPKNMKLKKLQIPIDARVESLNAATAISIAMYSYYVQITR